MLLANLPLWSQQNKKSVAKDSIQHALEKTKTIKQSILLLNNFSTYYVETGKVKLALYCNDLALEKLGDLKPNEDDEKLKLYGGVFNNRGAILKTLGDFKNAETWYLKSIEIRKKLNQFSDLADSWGNLGLVYQNLGNYPLAINYLYEALHLQEKINNQEGISSCQNNLGIIYCNLKNYSEAKKYFSQSLAYKINNKDHESAMGTYNNLANCYYELKEFDKAEEYYKHNLTLAHETKNPELIAAAYSNLGSVKETMGDYNAAIENFLKAETIARNSNNDFLLAVTLHNIASVQFKMNNQKSALVNAEQSLKMSQSLGDLEGVMESAELLTKIYKNKQLFQKALKAFEQYIAARDSVFNEESTRKSIQMNLKYEYEKKATADSVKIAEEKKVTEAQLKQEKTQRYALYGGLGLVGVFALFMVNRFQVTNRQKKLIEAQKLIVEEQKHIVEEKQKEILDSIHYAKRIQLALITNEHYIGKNIERIKNG